MASFEIRGVIPPMLTPFHDNGDVDYDAFISNIEKWNTETLGGYLVLGSTPRRSGCIPMLRRNRRLITAPSRRT